MHSAADDPLLGLESDDERDSEHPARREEPMLYCPVCSQKLSEHRCKLLCLRCGYYMSCADYY